MVQRHSQGAARSLSLYNIAVCPQTTRLVTHLQYQYTVHNSQHSVTMWKLTEKVLVQITSEIGIPLTASL